MSIPWIDDIDEREVVWKLTSTGLGVLAAVAVRAGARALWESVRGEEPPANPADPFTSWSDAVVWSMALGVGVAVGRLVARRGAAEGWERLTGSAPPGLVDPRRATHRIRDALAV